MTEKNLNKNYKILVNFIYATFYFLRRTFLETSYKII